MSIGGGQAPFSAGPGFPDGRSALEGQREEQAGKFTCCAVGKGTQRDFPIYVW